MSESREGPEGSRASSRTRAAMKRVLRRGGRPILGYFDHRFGEVHEHLDKPPTFDQLSDLMQHRFDELRRDLQQTREDVATDADTIAELAFTLERFADLFTARIEALAATFRPGEPASNASVIELPFAYAAASALEAGSTVATIGPDITLPGGLSALGLRVTVIGNGPVLSRHPDVVVVDEEADHWAGPGEPLHAVFALSSAWTAGNGPTPQLLDLCRKWLQPGGFLVLGLGPGATPDGVPLRELLSDWLIEHQEVFGPVAEGVWRRQEPRDVEQPPRPGVVVVRAVPRA